MAAKGLTQTSSLIQISAAVSESAVNTFTVEQIDLQLNPLDREVFVVQAVDLDLLPPQLIANSANNICPGELSRIANNVSSCTNILNKCINHRCIREVIFTQNL